MQTKIISTTLSAALVAALSMTSLATASTEVNPTPADTMPAASRHITVIAVEAASNVPVFRHGDPKTDSDPAIRNAIQRAGYFGSTILGYSLDGGSSLTVYVKG